MLEKLPIELGEVLKGQRAGIESIVFHRLLATRQVARMQLQSSCFNNMESLPVRYTADSDGLSPPLDWQKIPDDTASLALIVEDADSPTPHPLVHAIAVNLDPERGSLQEGALMMSDTNQATEVDLGVNSLLMRGWLPPDPPPGHGEHRYAFQLFALKAGAPLTRSAGRQQVYEAVLDRAIAAGCLFGTYERPRRIRMDETEQGLEMSALTPSLG